MRISVISAAVCCALFPLTSAAGLSVEQRLAQLEARLNLAEQQASEASRSANRPRLANKNSRLPISN